MALPAYKHEPVNKFGEDLAPEQEQKTKDDLTRLRSARAHPQSSNNTKPSAPTNLEPPGQYKKKMKIETGEETGVDKEGRIARALRARQAAKRQLKAGQLAKAGLAGAGKGVMQKYRQLKNIIRVIRGGAMVGTSLGDIFFSLGVLFLSLVGEWILEKSQIVEGYKMFDPEDPYVLLDKLLWYGGWAVIAAVLVLAAVLAYFAVYLSQNPTEALKFGIGL